MSNVKYHICKTWWEGNPNKTRKIAVWKKKREKKMAICEAWSGLCALRVTWCGGKEGEDKDRGVFTQLRAVWRRRSDMWWQHSATLLTQPASPGYWGRDHPRLDYLQACMPSKIFWEDTLKNPPSQGLLIGCCYHLLMVLTICKATFFHPFMSCDY